MHPRILLLCATATLAACSASEPPPLVASTPPAESSAPLARITGSASYRERMMPPPGAALEVVFEDIPRSDAAAEEIMRIVQPVTTAPPYPFTIHYDPARMVANHRYNLRARITAGGELLFVSDTASPVLGPTNIVHADLVLRRAGTADQVTPPSRPMRGMYSYMADAGWFVDCLSGERIPVAQERDNMALERAYSNARSMAGAPMLATVEGSIEQRLQMEGDMMRPTLIVQKFVSVEAQGCSGPSSTAELENTYWKLMTIDGKSADTPQGAREIHFVLNRASQRLSGFSGCNGMSGVYRVEGETIRFTSMAGTLMACPNGMEVERRVHDMFPRVTSWKISGETLQLADTNGTPIATFESRYLK